MMAAAHGELTLVGEGSSVSVAGGTPIFAARNKNNSAFSMSELKKASDRLEQAVDRLDAALANGNLPAQRERPPAMANAIAAAERERDSLLADLEALRLERARLARALVEARESQTAARQTNEAVAERLDDAIGSLRAILGA